MTECPALDIWDNLAWEAKEKVVAQVAHHVMNIFELRSTMAGSLYLSFNEQYIVGPMIVDPNYFKVIDGKPVYTNASVQQSPHRFRGPFSNTSDWLSSRRQRYSPYRPRLRHLHRVWENTHAHII
jgi:hypothetical protein